MAKSLTPKEFKDYSEQVLVMGATKYGADTWKRGEHFNPKLNCFSIIRHILKALGLDDQRVHMIIDNISNHIVVAKIKNELGRSSLDDESGLLHYKHAGTRSFMATYMLENHLGEFK